MTENASNYAVSLWAFAHVGRLECDSIHVSRLFIIRFKHLARLFSLNMSEQYWKMWHWIKHDFISLCNELISIGLLVTEFYMQHNFINATWLQKHHVKYIVNPKIQCKYSSSNTFQSFWCVVVDGEFLLEWCEYFGQPQVWYLSYVSLLAMVHHLCSTVWAFDLSCENIVHIYIYI